VIGVLSYGCSTYPGMQRFSTKSLQIPYTPTTIAWLLLKVLCHVCPLTQEVPKRAFKDEKQRDVLIIMFSIALWRGEKEQVLRPFSTATSHLSSYVKTKLGKHNHEQSESFSCFDILSQHVWDSWEPILPEKFCRREANWQNYWLYRGILTLSWMISVKQFVYFS
jgi:hypothetical protein